MTEARNNIGIDDSLLGGFTEPERARIRGGEDFAIWGWKDIARSLEISERTAYEHANRDFHPLEVVWEGRRPFVTAWYVMSWRKGERIAHRLRRELARLASPLVEPGPPARVA